MATFFSNRRYVEVEGGLYAEVVPAASIPADDASKDAVQALVSGGGNLLGYTELAPRLTAGSNSAASANAAAIEVAIAAGGQFSISVPGVYFITLVHVPSYTTLHIGAGVVIKKANSYYGLMFVNKAVSVTL